MENADSLRVGCILLKPLDYSWTDNYDAWSVVYPYTAEDFEEISGDAWEYSEEAERKLGYGDFESMEDSEQPMMNYYYPLEGDFDQDDAKKIVHTNLCLIHFHESDEYALALTGGGMDFSWSICEAYIRLGFYPPSHFRLPRMAGMRKTEKNLRIVNACMESRKIAGGWMESDKEDLKRTLEYLKEV